MEIPLVSIILNVNTVNSKYKRDERLTSSKGEAKVKL